MSPITTPLTQTLTTGCQGGKAGDRGPEMPFVPKYQDPCTLIKGGCVPGKLLQKTQNKLALYQFQRQTLA